jgi:SAM-dependent methyltransferase
LQRLLIQRFLDTITNIVHSSPPSTILDAGCAEGFVCQHLLEKWPDAQAVGIDVDIAALSRGKRLHTATQFGSGDIVTLPFKDKSFDLVICTEVLEHLPDPEAALSELQRVTRRHCLLSVPHEPFFRLSNLVRGKNISRLGDDVDHYQHWSAIAFKHLVSRYFSPVNSHFPFPWQVFLGEMEC